MRIEFFESCVPPKTGHHAKKIVRMGGFSRLADKPELVAAKSFWDALFLKHRPAEPFDEPIILTVVLTWPWNTGDSKRLRAQGRTWQDTKPDWENIAKTIGDAMGRCGFFTNDSRIVGGRIYKYRGDRPGVEVILTAAPAPCSPAPSVGIDRSSDMPLPF